MTTQTEQPETPIAAPIPPVVRRRLFRRKTPDTLPRLDHCLNCGQPTGADDNYCPRCGQENQNETVALRPLLSDVMAEVASWDSKLVRTVLPLLFRPGFLTNEYNAGRRARYLSPLKMYLVISALFFLVLPTDPLTSNMRVDPGGVKASGIGTSTGKAAKSKDDGGGSTNIMINGQHIDMAQLPKTVAAYDVQQKRLRPALRDPFLMQLSKRQLIKATANKQTFTQSVVQGLVGDLPKMMFALLPLFAVLLKVTYWRRRRLYVEHLIFALHAHAFTFALLTLAVLLSLTALPKPIIWTAFFLLLPVYLAVAMRRVYNQGWPKTLFKFAWLGFNYFLLLSFAFLATIAVAFFAA